MQSWNDFWQQRRWDGWKPWAKQVMRFEAECGWLCEGGIEMKMREEQIWGATNGACQVAVSRLGDWIKTQNVTQIVSQIMIHTMTEIWIVDWNLRYELQFRAWPKSELEFKSYLKSDSVWEIRPWLKSENSNHDWNLRNQTMTALESASSLSLLPSLSRLSLNHLLVIFINMIFIRMIFSELFLSELFLSELFIIFIRIISMSS